MRWYTPPRRKPPNTISIDSKVTPSKKLLNWVPCSPKNLPKTTSPYKTKTRQHPVIINCDTSEQIKEVIGNGPSVLVVSTDELIQLTPTNHSDITSPESEKTAQIREEIEVICRAVSASELFEIGQTHAIENKIEVISDKIIKQRLRTVPHHYREQFKILLEEQIQAGLIEESTSLTAHLLMWFGKRITP